MPKPKVTEAAGISSEAVQAKTGKTWSEWIAVLDTDGAAAWTHKEIATHLSEQHGCPGWWSQMVTVGYEQVKGLRVKHQKCDGEFSASASKTIAVPIADLYASWSEPKKLAQWLPDGAKMTVRRATANKSMRITWIDGETSVEVNFWNKGPAKSQVALEHNKLKDLAAVGRFKAYWTAALAKLQTLFEGANASEAIVRGPKRQGPIKKTKQS
ncbi:MAG TPA: hypothetical protein VHR66_07835 [Gemmataceae bacterium]|jgi:hypothetical protein|nr:hypothetical protein [Gemmataceae bacterium]